MVVRAAVQELDVGSVYLQYDHCLFGVTRLDFEINDTIQLHLTQQLTV